MFISWQVNLQQRDESEGTKHDRKIILHNSKILFCLTFCFLFFWEVFHHHWAPNKRFRSSVWASLAWTIHGKWKLHFPAFHLSERLGCLQRQLEILLLSHQSHVITQIAKFYNEYIKNEVLWVCRTVKIEEQVKNKENIWDWAGEKWKEKKLNWNRLRFVCIWNTIQPWSTSLLLTTIF